MKLFSFAAALCVVCLGRRSHATEPGRCGPFQYFDGDTDDIAKSETLQAAFSNLEAWLETLQYNLQAPSISFGVVYDQRLVYYNSLGDVNPESSASEVPPDADSIYRIGSVSKVWTVLMALQLRDRDVLSMDDPISKFHPEFGIQNPWGITADEKEGKTLTLHHLASQISGLPREAPCLDDCVAVSTSDIFQRLKRETMVHATGVQPSYSNLAYGVLGNVLSEYIGNKSFNKTLFETIIEPMGLRNTGLYLTPEQETKAATGYNLDGSVAGYVDLGWVGPAGQMFSSVNDLSKLLMQYFTAFPSLYQRELKEDFDFALRPQTLRDHLQPVFMHSDQETGFGSPWEMYFRDGHLVRSKGGNVYGFCSEIVMIPEMKLGLVILIAKTTSPVRELLQNGALDILVPAFTSWMEEQHLAAMKKHKSSQPSYESVVGTYGIDGVGYLTVQIDEISGLPTFIAPIFSFHGLLTPNSCSEESCQFVDNELFTDLSTCFTITGEAIDGNVFDFYQPQDDGKFEVVRVNGLLYGMELSRMKDGSIGENDHVLEQSRSFLRRSVKT